MELLNKQYRFHTFWNRRSIVPGRFSRCLNLIAVFCPQCGTDVVYCSANFLIKFFQRANHVWFLKNKCFHWFRWVIGYILKLELFSNFGSAQKSIKIILKKSVVKVANLRINIVFLEVILTLKLAGGPMLHMLKRSGVVFLLSQVVLQYTSS